MSRPGCPGRVGPVSLTGGNMALPCGVLQTMSGTPRAPPLSPAAVRNPGTLQLSTEPTWPLGSMSTEDLPSQPEPESRLLERTAGVAC